MSIQKKCFEKSKGKSLFRADFEIATRPSIFEKHFFVIDFKVDGKFHAGRYIMSPNFSKKMEKIL